MSVVSFLVIPWMIDLSGELSHVMKNGAITATLTPRNSGPKVMLRVWWHFQGVIHWEFVPNERAVDADEFILNK